MGNIVPRFANFNESLIDELTQPWNLGMNVLKVTHSSTIGHQILLLIVSLM
jgi:hypothetical protein